MPVKTNGAEWKRFLDDDTYWANAEYMEDEAVVGELGEDYTDKRDASIPDECILTLNGGVVRYKAGFGIGDSPFCDLEKFFKKWRKQQTHTTFSCMVPSDKVDQLKKYIKDLGGTIS